MKFSGKVDNGATEQMIKFWWRSVVFRIRHYWEIRKVASTDCAARRCSAGYTLAGVAIASTTSLRHRPLAEVCTIPMLLVTARRSYASAVLGVVILSVRPSICHTRAL